MSELRAGVEVDLFWILDDYLWSGHISSVYRAWSTNAIVTRDTMGWKVCVVVLAVQEVD
jgi:hypothetical protein